MSKFKKHIIIAGSARSGTSWLAEIISKTFRYRLLFEPDHENHVPKAKELLTDKLIETIDNKEQDLFLKSIFKNRIDNNWIAQNSNRKYKMHLWPLLPKKYIIKLIRSNLGVQAITKKYNIPIIFIIRNPYDVIFSQNRVKFPWLYDLSLFQQQNKLVTLIKNKTSIDITNQTLTGIEKLAVRWCIENVVPLQFQENVPSNISVIKYEDLKGNFPAFKLLVNNFSIELHPDIEKAFLKPSSKTHPKSEIIQTSEKINKFTNIEYLAVKGILKKFQLNLYSI